MSFYVGRKSIRKVPGTVIKAAPLPRPDVKEGFGVRAEAGRICAEAGYGTALLLTDNTLFGLGLHQKVADSLTENGINFSVFHDIDGEPTAEMALSGRNAAVECGARCIIAVGGGSVMDCGKIIAASAKHPHQPISHYLHKFAIVEGGTLPMINIPSTAGTGAEFTVGAVIKKDNGTKNSTVIIGLQVPHVLLDSELTVNAPKSVTVWCGIDALSHGLEGLLADVRSSGEDVRKSRECVRLVLKNLPMLLDDPQNIDARQAMLLAAHYGGNAINTQLAGYVHAFAHTIGAIYHIPHGKAIAWSLIPVVATQAHLKRAELAALAVHCGLAGEDEAPHIAADKLLTALKDLLDSCGLDKDCPLINVDDYDRLTSMIDADSVNYSPPSTLTDNEIRSLLDRIRRGF